MEDASCHDMRRLSPSIFALLTAIGIASLPACDSSTTSSDDEALSSKDKPMQWANEDDVDVIGRAMCVAGNGTHRVGTFDPKTFSAKSVTAYIKDRDASRGCMSRSYSTSRQDAVVRYVEFAKKRLAGRLSVCDDDGVDSSELADDLRSLVEADDNRAVFTSTDAGGEATCDYFDVYVFRADRTVIKLNFDYSD